MSESRLFPSIGDNIAPLEQGGVIARDGFDFQDHVAVYFCLDMLSDSDLLEVRCENHDDITLKWQSNGSIEVEFIQVKGNQLNQLWSVAELCKKEKKDSGNGSAPATGNSILEKSLSNDRFAEVARFRIVTRSDINKELSILKLKRELRSSRDNEKAVTDLLNELHKKVATFRSQKGNDYKYWAMNTVWQVEHSTEAISLKNKNKLRGILESSGETLTTDQIDKAYEVLLSVVQKAALANWQTHYHHKILQRETILVKLGEVVEEIRRGPITPISQKMAEKMEAAQISTELIAKAHDLRSHYRQYTLTTRYISATSLRSVEMEIYAKLQELLSKLDVGKIASEGPEFHNLCLEELGELHRNLNVEEKPLLAFFQGCMYYITGRCDHRFLRATYEIHKEP